MAGRPKRQQPEKKKTVPPALKGEAQMLEFMIVNFRENRTVDANGVPVGVTNHLIVLPAGNYVVTLSGDAFSPADQRVTLADTSATRPTIVIFT